MAIVIGLGYQARSGKDTVAQMILELAEQAGIPAVRRAFADVLKEECASFLSHVVGVSYKEILRQMHGTTEEKARWRRVIQWWGTEFRRHDDDNYWTNKLREWIDTHCTESCQIVVVPDVRFTNEAEMCKSYPNHFVILVERPGLDCSDTHVSETQLADYPGWNGIIVNDGSLADLEARVKDAFIFMIAHTMTSNEECNTAGNGQCAMSK